MNNQEIKELICEKTLKKGDFTLSSGKKSKYIFDIMELIQEQKFIDEFRKFVEHESFLVGIEFGGSILAAMSNKPFALIRKDGTIYGKIPNDYSLIDDVVTTEKNIRNSLFQLLIRDKFIPPKNIITIVDRRDYDKLFFGSKSPLPLHIESMLRCEDRCEDYTFDDLFNR